MKNLLDKDLILFGIDENKQPERKYYLHENIPSVLPYADSDDALLKELGIPFDNPKPGNFVQSILHYFLRDNDIVIDFFAGSRTIAHACIKLNTEMEYTNKFITVQLPEKIEESKKEQKIAYKFCKDNNLPENISEISKERIRRSAKKIQKENSTFKGDFGFKVFKLARSNIKVWNPERTDIEASLLDHAGAFGCVCVVSDLPFRDFQHPNRHAHFVSTSTQKNRASNSRRFQTGFQVLLLYSTCTFSSFVKRSLARGIVCL
jgi:adenine-specific DNA-methyltransferase